MQNKHQGIKSLSNFLIRAARPTQNPILLTKKIKIFIAFQSSLAGSARRQRRGSRERFSRSIQRPCIAKSFQNFFVNSGFFSRIKAYLALMVALLAATPCWLHFSPTNARRSVSTLPGQLPLSLTRILRENGISHDGRDKPLRTFGPLDVVGTMFCGRCIPELQRNLT